jgi:hypothetical protein
MLTESFGDAGRSFVVFKRRPKAAVPIALRSGTGPWMFRPRAGERLSPLHRGCPNQRICTGWMRREIESPHLLTPCSYMLPVD